MFSVFEAPPSRPSSKLDGTNKETGLDQISNKFLKLPFAPGLFRPGRFASTQCRFAPLQLESFRRKFEFVSFKVICSVFANC